MATLREIVDGLHIIAKYRDEGLDSYGIQAEHDEIYAGTDDDKKVSTEDEVKLEELGWHYDKSSGCFRHNV